MWVRDALDVPPLRRRTHIEDARRDALWYKDAVVYQLHVKAFADASGDGIGDFRGLIARLPYIAELGATAIWLLPFSPSPLRDDGYDVADYTDVHPQYGTMDDFRAFVAAAHGLGLRVITEFVVNHTSDRHAWFERARRAAPGSSERDFYVWSDTTDRYAQTRIIFTDTETSNWTWDPVAGAFFWHRFFSHQPDLNFDNPAVFDAMCDVMRFWFDAGVDGMRLDAVPYLCEREGTNNENLPETHAILKRFRAVVDREYPDRFFLAEANQWPEDVRAYFGEGDECHMAFHFPLMPRMFMAIADEDRYPVYDIMRQTPAIPDNCQWAIFLRNHDEMTLEMVTDRERAFMYSVYASDARARVNVGIRRRLAPLLQNDRRRIELMTSLLLSMPGTPIVYYGDEIGMGDNIYLGDRDGVRTPMQWSGDRNGGFSRADEQQLYLPAIMDPVYGFAAVNVEAQERNPSSLLNWVKRLIAIRREHTVFGRGSLTFLYPDNRRVAAYVREYGDETVLCVANLATSPQAVAIDLSRFAARVPVELAGGSAFPPIVDDRYVLTLPGHAFFWFSLVAASAAPAPLATTRPVIPEFVTLVLPEGLVSLHDERVQRIVERDVIPPYLSAHGLAVGTIRQTDLLALAPGDNPPLLALFEGERAAIVPLDFIEADESEGTLAIVSASLARGRRGPRVGYLYDASIADRFWKLAWRAIVEQREIEGHHGSLHCAATWSLADLPIDDPTLVRRLPLGAMTRSAVIGESVILSFFRQSERGNHPELEIALVLHEAAFRHAPPLLGTIVYSDADGSIACGLAHRFVLNAGDAWDVMTRTLERMLERARNGEPSQTEAQVSLRTMESIGDRLAKLHVALASAPGEAFAPERDAEGVHRIRIHGDFRLGRVLVTEYDVLLVDIGGDRGLTISERREKADPVNDCATMLESIAEAGAQTRSDDPVVAAWVHDASECFLAGWLAATAGAAFAPQSRAALDDRLRQRGRSQ